MLVLLWYMQSVSHAGNLDEFPTVSYVKDPEVDSRPTPRTVTSLLSLVVPRCRASTGVLWRCSVPSPIRVSSACACASLVQTTVSLLVRSSSGHRVRLSRVARRPLARWTIWEMTSSPYSTLCLVLRGYMYCDSPRRSSFFSPHFPREGGLGSRMAPQGGFGSISHVFCVKTEARILTSIPALLVRRR